MNHGANITRIKSVSNGLADLNDKVVFVGGATISLYIDRVGIEVRATDDVDVIIEILNYNDRIDLEKRLGLLGFQPDTGSGIICRYIFDSITVDIMPTDDATIGFKNIWYPAGFINAVEYNIDDNHAVKILSLPYFIATKIEAYKDRGKNDGRTSHDFEDIIYVLENRSTVWEELRNCTGDIGEYLKAEFINLLNNSHFYEWVGGHVERNFPPQTDHIISELKKYVDR